MRDFLFSDIAAMHGLANVPDDPDLAIAAGARLCEELLEPLQDRFGRLAIRSAYRSCQVNALGSRRKIVVSEAASRSHQRRRVWRIRYSSHAAPVVSLHPLHEE